MKKLLVYHLDDNPRDLSALAAELRQIKTTEITVNSFQSPEEMIAQLKQKNKTPDLIILDIELKHKMTGLQVCQIARELHPHSVILIYSNHIHAATAQAAAAAGADDLFSKSAPPYLQVDHCLQVYTESLISRMDPTKDALSRYKKTTIIGVQTQRIAQRMLSIIDSQLRGGVLITGERGVGKTFCLHLLSQGIPKGIPKVLLQGAPPEIQEKIKKASDGWILIDEIETLTLEQQNELLELLHSASKKTKGIRIGATSRFSVDELKTSNRVCFDLIRYLMSSRIEIPPLRERTSEISDFADHFLSQLSGGPYSLQSGVRDLLNAYSYSEGNVSEIQKTIQQMKVFVSGSSITLASVPPHLLKGQVLSPETRGQKSDKIEIVLQVEPQKMSFLTCTNQLLIQLMIRLRQSDRAQDRKTTLSNLAERIGLSRTALKSRLDQMIRNHELTRDELWNLIRG
jgi:DNA-binding NtrC family response regulator